MVQVVAGREAEFVQLLAAVTTVQELGAVQAPAETAGAAEATVRIRVGGSDTVVLPLEAVRQAFLGPARGSP